MKGTSIFIFIAAAIIIGLAVSPIKNMGKENGGKKAISSIGGEESEEQKILSRREMAESIKDIEKKVESMKKSGNSEEVKAISPHAGKVRMSKISGLKQSNPDREYIALSTSLEKNEELNITGWFLRSEVTGYTAVIGKAAPLPFPYSKTLSDIVLLERDRVILTKGFSPIGISFRTNKCTGYFEENRTFYPALPKQCPLPEDEKLPVFSSIDEYNENCVDAIEDIPRCTTRDEDDLPKNLTDSCKAYVSTLINYNSCVATHFGDTDFPGNEYRVYFNKFGPFWRTTHDTINLHDSFGLIVDTIEY